MGARFEALDEGVLAAASKSTGYFFAISISQKVRCFGTVCCKQVQALERLVKNERKRLEDAFSGQKSDQFKVSERNWLIKLEAVNRTSDEQMEQRLKLLAEQQEELDDLISTDAEAYVDMVSFSKSTPGMVTITIQIESPSFKENLNQGLSVSLVMTASVALANEGLFELT